MVSKKFRRFVTANPLSLKGFLGTSILRHGKTELCNRPGQPLQLRTFRQANGGVSALKAICAPYSGLTFMPTGWVEVIWRLSKPFWDPILVGRC